MEILLKKPIKQGKVKQKILIEKLETSMLQLN